MTRPYSRNRVALKGEDSILPLILPLLAIVALAAVSAPILLKSARIAADAQVKYETHRAW